MPAPRSAVTGRAASSLNLRTSSLRLLAWNIRQGGGTRLPAICDALRRHEADASLATRMEHHALAIGDFNTCRAYVDEPGAIDKCAHFMDRVAALGFCDLWRQRYPEGREFSWYSHRGNGFRIDHAFLSTALARRAGPIRYSHEERLSGLSDHSALILDLPG
jgi:exonuclease III